MRQIAQNLHFFSRNLSAFVCLLTRFLSFVARQRGKVRKNAFLLGFFLFRVCHPYRNPIFFIRTGRHFSALSNKVCKISKAGVSQKCVFFVFSVKNIFLFKKWFTGIAFFGKKYYLRGNICLGIKSGSVFRRGAVGGGAKVAQDSRSPSCGPESLFTKA